SLPVIRVVICGEPIRLFRLREPRFLTSDACNNHSSFPMDFDEKRTTHEMSRRNFLFSTAAASAISVAVPSAAAVYAQTPTSFSSLQPLGDRVHPITPDE